MEVQQQPKVEGNYHLIVESGEIMTFKRAMKILDPTYKLQDETLADVEDACRFAIRAMSILQKMPDGAWLEADDEAKSNK